MKVPGGVPEPRPDQALQPISRAGSGPAPQTNVFSRIIVVTGGSGGIFLYSPVPGPGNLIGSWTAAAGTDAYGNTFPKGINVTSGVLANVIVTALQLTVNPGPSFFDGPKGAAFQVFTTVGVNNWTAPAGVTSVQVFCTGAGGNGGSGHISGDGGGGGGGGELASDGAVAVTPATVYHPTIGAPGSNTTFAGDVVTVTAHPGQNGTNGGASTIGTGGLGGTGSTNSVHFNGGLGGNANPQANSGGGGGGGSAVGYQAGNPGLTSDAAGDGGTGGAALPAFPVVSGAGGNGGIHAVGAGANGSAPGGGAGGGGDGGNAGGTGANGQVVLVWSSGSTSTYAAIATAGGTTDPVTGTTVGAGITTIDPTFGDTANLIGNNVNVSNATTWNVNGVSLDVSTVGTGLRVAEGSNAKQGTATLAAGTVVVANTSVTANSRIFLTAQTTGAGPGALRVSARTPATSFTITSSNAADTSLVAYEIFEPG